MQIKWPARQDSNLRPAENTGLSSFYLFGNILI